MNNSKEKIKLSIKENLSLMKSPLMSILPGQISFFIILSIIPLISIIVMLISKLSLDVNLLTNFISRYMPLGVSNILLSIFEEQKAGAVDIVFIVMAFYLASKATHSIIVASTRIYNGKQKDFLSTRIKAIIMLVILVLLVLFMLSIVVIGGEVVNYLLSINTKIHPLILWFYKLAKWPFAFFMIFFVIKVIYTIAPNEPIPSRSVNKGALITTIAWGVSTYAYSFYVLNLANYSKFYGNLSNLVIAFIWVYWLSYAFVFGMTFNEYRLNK